MQKLKIRIKHPIKQPNKASSRCRCRCRHRPPPVTFPANKKRERDPATGGGRDPPQRPGGERDGHPQAAGGGSPITTPPLSLSLPPGVRLQPQRLPSPAPDPAAPLLQRLLSLSPFLSLSPKKNQRKNQNQSLYLLQVSANNKKFIPLNHHKQILPINPLNLYQISQPNQPNNKQNQINVATSNQENFLWPFLEWQIWYCGGWASPKSQIYRRGRWASPVQRVFISDLVQWVGVGFAAGGVQWSWWAEVASGGVHWGSLRERNVEKY